MINVCEVYLWGTRSVVGCWLDYAEKAGISDDRAIEVQLGILHSTGRRS